MPSSRHGIPEDLFAGVVATLADSSESIVTRLFGHTGPRLAIDPRPLETRPAGGANDGVNALTLAGSPVVDSLSPSEMLARRRVLESAGVANGDVNVFSQCPGSAPTMRGTSGAADKWKACPPDATVVAAFGSQSRRHRIRRSSADPGRRPGKIRIDRHVHDETSKW